MNNRALRDLSKSFKVNLLTRCDDYKTLSHSQIGEVITEFFKQKEKNSMLNLELGSIVRIFVKDYNSIIEYDLTVESIDAVGIDTNGDCKSSGFGITKYDELLAQKYTRIIDKSTLVKIII